MVMIVRLGALLMALMLAVPLSIFLEPMISAPSIVGAGLAGCLGVGFYELIRSRLTRWLEQG